MRIAGVALPWRGLHRWLLRIDDGIAWWWASLESRLALRTRARGRGLRKVILPCASVEFFDLFDLLPRRPAHGTFLRFGHSPRGFQFSQSLFDGAHGNVHYRWGLADGDLGRLQAG